MSGAQIRERLEQPQWTNVRMPGEFFTTVSSLNAFHPVLDVVAGGNSSGKVSIWR